MSQSAERESMSKKRIFQPFPRFVLRTPLFPITFTDVESDIFKEAIYLASPELYEGNKSNNPQKQQKYEESLLKYQSRACTRCTPFGLFAGCSVGNIGSETKIELLPATDHKRITRLDMQYLCALIQEIERMSDIRRQLLFYPNDSLFAIGSKLRYIEYHYKNSQRLHHTVSLEIDEPLEMVLETAKNGTTTEALAVMFVNKGIEYEEAVAYINDIINSQVLKSELDPCVVGEDVLTSLISKLSRLHDVPILDTLKKIQALLAKIDASPIGSTLPLYKEVITLVDRLGVKYEAKFLFQTDMFSPVREATIASQIPARLDELIQFLGKISAHRENPNLSKFKQAFSARYEEAEIPLTQVMDNELGLGYSESLSGGNDISPLVDDLVFPGSASYLREMQFTYADQILLKKYTECIRENGTVISLSDADYKDLNFTHTFPDTLAVMCSLLPNEQIYIKSIGGASGANLLGRFCHIDRSIYDLVKESADFEQKQVPDQIIAEISHLPESRIGNIASRPVFRDYTLHYLSNYEKDGSDIPISDLMLSIKNGRLFLRSKKYDKEVIPRLTCAHNYSLSPIPIYRFLCDMQQQDKTTGLYYGWNGYFEGLDYLPQIQYKGVILARQRWRIRQEEVEGFGALPTEELRSRMDELIARKRLPRYVIVPDADNELYLDLEDSKYQRLLLNLIKQRKAVVVEEFLFDCNHSVVQQAGAPYTNEVIILFHK